MFSSCFFQDSKNERYSSSPYQRANEPWTAQTLLPKEKVLKAPFLKSSTYRKPQSSLRIGSGLIKEKRFTCPRLENQKVFGGVRGGDLYFLHKTPWMSGEVSEWALESELTLHSA